MTIFERDGAHVVPATAWGTMPVLVWMAEPLCSRATTEPEPAGPKPHNPASVGHSLGLSS